MTRYGASINHPYVGKSQPKMVVKPEPKKEEPKKVEEKKEEKK